MITARSEVSLNDIAGPVEGEAEFRGQFSTPEAARTYLLGGRATVTVQSARTGARYTFRVAAPRSPNPASPVWFVSLLSGPDNESDYTYLGTIFGPAPRAAFRLTRKSRMQPGSGPVIAVSYLVESLFTRNALPAGAALYHEGRCGRCGRTLTVPESVTSGFGPECRSIMEAGR